MLAPAPLEHHFEFGRAQGRHSQEVEHARSQISKRTFAELSTLVSRAIRSDELQVLFDDTSPRAEDEPAHVRAERGKGCSDRPRNDADRQRGRSEEECVHHVSLNQSRALFDAVWRRARCPRTTDHTRAAVDLGEPTCHAAKTL